MDALPSYDYELALEIEHLSSISEVPEDKWEAFVNFYKEYSNPNKNTNQNKKFLKESKKSQKTAVLRPIMKRV